MDRQWREETTQMPTVVSKDVMCRSCDVVPSCKIRREFTSSAGTRTPNRGQELSPVHIYIYKTWDTTEGNYPKLTRSVYSVSAIDKT